MSSRPVVAIVGRPNVGKSTLFNRLTGRRTALVSDMPGLTRDRREGEAQVGSHAVTVVDTAGFEEAAAGSIGARMRRQTESAVDDADVVLFVFDAREGITPTDTAFARIVRASGRPVIVVANKSEGRAGEAGFYDAFSLGFGDPVAISAEHGEGLIELLDDVSAALGLPESKSAREGGADEAADSTARPIRVAIVGRPNVGKSTLVNALLGTDRMITGPEPGLTRDAVASDLVFEGRRIELFDTAGLRRKAKVTEVAEKLATGDAMRAVRFTEVAVLVIDAERALEHQDLTIGHHLTEEGRALVIAVNKWDLVENKQKMLKELRETASEKLSQVSGVSLLPVSAVGERGLKELMRAVLAAYETWNRRVPTPDLNRWLAEATERHPPPAVSGRRVRIRFMTQPSTRPPTFVCFCSRPEALPKSYVRYLANSLRQVFKLPGVPLRFNFRKSGGRTRSASGKV